MNFIFSLFKILLGLQYHVFINVSLFSSGACPGTDRGGGGVQYISLPRMTNLAYLDVL